MARGLKIKGRGNTGLTCLEFLVIVALFGIAMAIVLSSLGHGHGEAARRASCQNNLKQLGLVILMYANESKGHMHPPMQLKDCNDKPLAWSKTMDVAILMPEYLSDETILICPTNYIKDWDSNMIDSGWYGGESVNPDFPQESPYTLNNVVDPCEMMENSYTYYSHVILYRGDTELVDDISIHSFQKDFTKILDRTVLDTTLLNDNFKLSHDSNLFPKFTNDLRWYAEYSEKNGPFKKGGPPLSEEEILAWREKRRQENERAKQLDIKHPGEILRIRDGVGRFFISEISNPATTDTINSEIVVMHDRIPKDLSPAHALDGVNILFLDGHVEFVKNDEEGKFVFGEVGEIVQRRW